MLLSKDVQIVQHILVYAVQVGKTLEKFAVTQESFAGSYILQNATCMPVMQIGELVKHLSDEFRAAHSEIPWRAIAGMRDHFAHEYGHMDVVKTWNTLVVDIPALAEYCRHILADNGAVEPEVDDGGDL